MVTIKTPDEKNFSLLRLTEEIKEDISKAGKASKENL